MPSISKILAALTLPLLLLAQEPSPEDLQKAMQNFLLLMEKSTEALKEMSQTEQKAVPESRNSWMLYYKEVKNGAKVQKRSDILIKTQIEYRYFRDQNISASTILVTVRDGIVELYGKVHSTEAAQKAIDLALTTRGVKEVISYLIVKEPQKLSL